MKTNAVILAAGEGKRMKSDKPKALCEVLFKPMLSWVLSACEGAGIDKTCIVAGYHAEMIQERFGADYPVCLQTQRLGTGHAAMMARDFLQQGGAEHTIVLYGDAPLIDAQTIRDALAQHVECGNAVTVISAELDDPYGYGRIIRTGAEIDRIVEQKDASEEERAVHEVNSGVYWFRTADLLRALDCLRCDNAQGEYYLTDTIAILKGMGLRAGVFRAAGSDVILGANDRKGLLELNEIARRRVIERHLNNGVEFLGTDGVIIGRDVEIGAGTTILPGTILRGKTVVGKDCVLGPNSLVEDAEIGDGCIVNASQIYQSKLHNDVKMGPFVHIRPNSELCDNVKIGDFVEVKNSVVGERTAIAHLTYVGDSDVGKHVNFGCGVVTVNYDGAKKSRTVIGDEAFIGCNTNLVAPVKVGDGAYTAAGSTITKNVPDHALAIERGEMRIKEGYALRKLKR